MMTELYPLLFKPVLKNYVWGGRHLTELGRALPAGQPVAESWEIAAHDDGMTVVENGPFMGRTLQFVLDELGLALIGSRSVWALERGKFPLLVKLLDANKRLSVQVHPDDVYAQSHLGNELGKTEMWVVLKAEPEAAIIYGLSGPTAPAKLREAIEAGELEPFLNRIPIKAGDHVCVPAGTVHAILEGAVIAEIQQNSNTTYRLYDWNRLGLDGKPRPLHVDRGLAVVDYEQAGLRLPAPVALEEQVDCQRELLCQNPYFTTERWRMHTGAVYRGECDGTSFEIWGVVQGRVQVAGLALEAVRFVLLPADLGVYEVKAEEDVVLLRTFVGEVGPGAGLC